MIFTQVFLVALNELEGPLRLHFPDYRCVLEKKPVLQDVKAAPAAFILRAK